MSTDAKEQTTTTGATGHAGANDPVHAPLGRVALGSLVAPAVIGGLFTLAALSQPAAESDVGRSALLGLAAGLIGAAAGLAVVFAANPRPAVTWPMTMLFAGGIRLFGGLAAAVPLYLLAGADKLPFWGVFLAVALTAIFGEVASLGAFLRSLAPSAAAGPASPLTQSAEARSA